MVDRVVWRGCDCATFPPQLHDLQDRNMECLGMLHESQEEIKELRSKCGPAAHLGFSQAYGVFTGVRDKKPPCALEGERSLGSVSRVCCGL